MLCKYCARNKKILRERGCLDLFLIVIPHQIVQNAKCFFFSFSSKKNFKCDYGEKKRPAAKLGHRPPPLLLRFLCLSSQFRHF
eukprot:08064.XXX_482126_482374_1 [CDS] Oithona nana genome sequencing.